jgi:hypothetical protein
MMMTGVVGSCSAASLAQKYYVRMTAKFGRAPKFRLQSSPLVGK